jgi:hypothetical protein
MASKPLTQMVSKTTRGNLKKLIFCPSENLRLWASRSVLGEPTSQQQADAITNDPHKEAQKVQTITCA